MTKTYKLLIESPMYPKDTLSKWDSEGEIYKIMVGVEWVGVLFPGQIENRPTVWELQEDKLDLRSAEAERMREEARSKRWEYIPEENDLYYVYNLEYINNVYINTKTWEKDAVDFYYWNMGNCHRTREEARLWGKKYARYFLTE